MKKNIKLKKFALLVWITSLGFTSMVQALPIMQNAQMLDKINLQDKALVSYQTDVSLNLNKDSIQNKLTKLEEYTGIKMTNREFKEIGDKLIIQDSDNLSSTLDIDSRSGSFSYNTGMDKYYKEATTPNLLGETQALDMAYKHLENLNLIPQKEQLGVITQGGLNMSIKKENGYRENYKKMTSIRIDRQLNGIPVFGKSRIFINMGSNGELANMIYQWDKIIFSKEIISDETITIDDVKKSIYNRLEKEAKNTVKINLNKINLVLFDDGKGIIEPAYHVETQCFYTNTKGLYDIPLDFYVPILKKPRAFYPFMNKVNLKPIQNNKNSFLLY